MPAVYFGEVQAFGLAVGVLTSLLGVLLYWPRKSPAPKKEEPESPSVPAHE
jgi:hypothetical protein